MISPTAPGTHDGRLGLRESLAALRQAQKPARGVSAYSIYVNRPAGRWLASLAHQVHATPNQVSIASGVTSGTAIALLALVSPSAALGVLVAALLVLGFALDAADGQLARLRGISTPAGEWLDHVLDCAIKVALHSAVLIGWYRFWGIRGAWLLVPLAFQLVSLLLFFGGVLVGKLREQQASPAGGHQGGGLRAWLLLPVDHGVLCLTFLAWGSYAAFRDIYTVLLVATAAFLAAFAVSWFRELS
jgi:phosphatidylglycerophosphate synthase